MKFVEIILHLLIFFAYSGALLFVIRLLIIKKYNIEDKPLLKENATPNQKLTWWKQGLKEWVNALITTNHKHEAIYMHLLVINRAGIGIFLLVLAFTLFGIFS